MEKPKNNKFITVLILIIKWFSAAFSVALFITAVAWFYRKINKFPEEIKERISNATDDKDEKTT
jgi:hypothetical protein